MAHLFDVPAGRFRRYSIAMASCLVFAAGSISALAQQAETEVIANAGESYTTASDLLLSWTIGEMAIETYSEGNILLAQGFHQPAIKVTMLLKSEDVATSFSIFPNPVMDKVTIRIGKEVSVEKLQNMRAELRNIEGRLIREATFNTQEYSLDMEMLANGTYFLQVTDASGVMIASSKIEKLR